MVFSELIRSVENEPVFETGLLLSGNVSPEEIRLQLSRWTATGKIIRLRRGLYALAPPYRKVIPHPFLVANRLEPGSYVSLQSALAYAGVIPEGVITTTSVTLGRPVALRTPIGEYDFRHIHRSWFKGYSLADLGDGQKAFVASPEKALLDLVYLQPKGDTEGYLRELRLEAMEKFDLKAMEIFAKELNKPKLLRAVKIIRRLAEEDVQGYESL